MKTREIEEIEIKLSKTQTSLGKVNARLKMNKAEYNLKITALMNKNKKLEEENLRLQKRIKQELFGK